MNFRTRTAPVAVLALLLAAAPAARAQDSDTTVVHDPARYEIVVSATRTPTRTLEIPGGAVVVRGDELRRMGARTLADALADVVGLETGGGSDNGSRLPNIGMWGLKEFDALLITLDGVPVGGPFNPSLAQIAIDDVDRLEITKGPQGTMYGVSAFAGMVQVFTRQDAEEGVRYTLGGGSFGDVHGRAAAHHSAGDWNLDALLGGGRADGWQDRTASQVERGRLTLRGHTGGTRLAFDLVGLSDRQDWGTPVPYDAGEPLPGFTPEGNNAPLGASVEHGVWALSSRLSTPLGRTATLGNTMSLTRDRQVQVRSFMSVVAGDTVGSAGIAIQPRENVFFDDLSLVSRFHLGGPHELVSGAAVTWGHTKAQGIGFDFDQRLGDPASIPDWQSVPVGDHRSFDDRRTFFGVYSHDTWTPSQFFTIAGGGRWDMADEVLHAFGQEVGGDPAFANDKRTDRAWSGDVSTLFRFIPENSRKDVSALNAYAALKSSFKPSAPNLTEAESAHILDPERTHSIEGGLKGELYEGQVSFAASVFQMDFHNMVVSTLDGTGTPALLNAGHERFKGYEINAVVAPSRLPGLSLAAGWAQHDPRFVEFTFVTPDGQLRNVSGKYIELAPRELWNARASYSRQGASAWVAARHEGKRPLTRRNTFWTPAYEQVDAGASYEYRHHTLTVTGRNLGDSRHPVGESDIGDSMFYIAPPRSVSAELSVRF